MRLAKFLAHAGVASRRAAEGIVGEGRVTVGARSALFLPYRDLGLIVADEAHEASFKQEDGVQYHARDVAVMRAKLEEKVCPGCFQIRPLASFPGDSELCTDLCT